MSFKEHVTIERRMSLKRDQSLLAKVLTKMKGVIKRKVVSYHSSIGKLIN